MNDKWRKKDYYPSLLFFLLSMSALCFYVYKCNLKIVSPVLCCIVLPVCLLYHFTRNSKKQWLLIKKVPRDKQGADIYIGRGSASRKFKEQGKAKPNDLLF